MEHGVYRALLRLGFEMDISLIQVLAITQNTLKHNHTLYSARRGRGGGEEKRKT